ncbi:MAG: serine/threonine protein kinase [Deltaproteobacteria bacterium]|nr:serine/threonine protein kinase [Deltaproteobacteria bacterium]
MLGETIGNYEVLETLGAGGMGTVYLATHKLIGRKAAIKVLLPELSAQRDMVSRFFNEARSTAHIRHVGIIDVFDFGFHDSGCAYIAMEFLEGQSLAALLRGAPRQSPDFVAAIGRQVASAVAAAHAREIVHRDLKPDNIFLIADDEVAFGVRAKVLDFGIAKLAAERGAATRTRTGSIMGTPAYMSPEQCRGSGSVDARTDVYSLGCVLYEMATGRMPFAHEGMGELLMAHMVEAPRPPRELSPELPAELEAVILRALAKDPAQRQQSMDELGRELGGRPSSGLPAASPGGPRSITGAGPRTPTTLGSSVVVRGEPAGLSGRRWAFPAAALLAVFSVLGWLWLRRPERPRSAQAVGAQPAPSPMAPGLAAAPDAALTEVTAAADAAVVAERADAGAVAPAPVPSPPATAPQAHRRGHGRAPERAPERGAERPAPTSSPSPSPSPTGPVRHNEEGTLDPFGGK